jgi:hypothetical protein
MMEELNSETMILLLSVLISKIVGFVIVRSVKIVLLIFIIVQVLYVIFYLVLMMLLLIVKLVIMMSVSNISFYMISLFVVLPSIVCEDSARLFSMYIINFKYIIKMDNYDSFIFDGLLDRYIEEQAKFKKGQVVYMEYTYQYHNQTKLGVCVGIVTEVGITKVERTVGNNKYINYPIVYTVTHAKGVSRCVSECKLGSVSEHILKERLKRDGKNNEQNNEPATND